MFKQVIVTRKDLKLSKGKFAVQVAHASIQSYRNSSKKSQEEWEQDGSKKVVVKVDTLKEMLNVWKKAKSYKIPCALIKDAGRTEVAPGTITALGIGPDCQENIDKITGNLKML